MGSAPLKILMVDDQQLLLWAMQRACKGRALEITTATTNEQALTAIELCRYDLFLLDFHIRDENRQALLKTIDELCPYVPVLLMTTNDTSSCRLTDVIRNVRKQGAWHLLEKPFSLDQIISYVELIFRERRNLKLGLNPLIHCHGNDKRQQLRRPYVLSVFFYYKTVIEGEINSTYTGGIITDVSDCGLGLISHCPLKPDQTITFGETMMNQAGVVAWSSLVEDQSCRAGIRLC